MPSRAARIYVAVLCIIATPIVVLSLVKTSRPLDLMYFAAIFLVIEKLRPRRQGPVGMSLTALIAIATYPVLGLWGAPAFVVALLANSQRAVLHRRLYNVAQNVVCCFAGGLVYFALDGPVDNELTWHAFPYVLIPVTAANLVHHLLNLLLLSGALWLDTRVGLVRQLSSIFTETMLASVGYGYLGVVIAVLWLGKPGPIAGPLLLVPLLVARWALMQWDAEHTAHQATLRALAQAIETKDLYTRGHGERVSKASRMLGTELGWEGPRLDAVAEAGLLHDVGKIGVPTRVLQKDGRLTDEEFEAIKAHPLHGVSLVGEIAFLEDARAGIMHHHERYDGKGYPSGLEGESIPIFARVLGIADAFDCMTSVRSYRAARPVDEAIEELIRCKGGHFDPALVDQFVAAVKRHGWEPAATDVQPDATPRPTAYDHDDPTRPPQVEDSRGAS